MRSPLIARPNPDEVPHIMGASHEASPLAKGSPPAIVDSRPSAAAQQRLQQLADHSPRALQLQRSVQLLAGTSPADASPRFKPRTSPNSATIQRVVIPGSAPGKFQSSLDPHNTQYDSEANATNVDQVISELQQLLALAQGRLASIPAPDLGRLQRMAPGVFNSWVPVVARTNPTVVSLAAQVVAAMAVRRIDLPRDGDNGRIDAEWKEWVRLLVADGFANAQGIATEITGAPHPALAAGYKIQLLYHMRSRANHTLSGVEVEYGHARPSGYHPRADEEQVHASTQATQPDFYDAEAEARKKTLVEYKHGYRDEKSKAKPLWDGFEQYGGVAPHGGGGVEHTSSTPPEVRYQWSFNNPPGYVSAQIPAKAAAARATNPSAFAGGLSLGGRQILGPVPRPVVAPPPPGPTPVHSSSSIPVLPQAPFGLPAPAPVPTASPSYAPTLFAPPPHVPPYAPTHAPTHAPTYGATYAPPPPALHAPSPHPHSQPLSHSQSQSHSQSSPFFFPLTQVPASGRPAQDWAGFGHGSSDDDSHAHEAAEDDDAELDVEDDVSEYLTPAYKSQYSRRAHALASAINAILLDNEVSTQVAFGWDQWDGTYEAWRAERIDSVRHWLSATQLRQLSAI